MERPPGTRPLTLLAATWLACSSATGVAQGSDPAPWVGRWVAEADPITVVLWIELRVEDGRLVGDVMQEDERSDPTPVESAVLDGNRLTLRLEALDGEEGGTLLLERLPEANALRVVRSTLPGRRLGRVTLTPRDDIWWMARSQMRDMGHDADGTAYSGRALRTYMELAAAVTEGIRTAGRDTARLDDAEVECVVNIISDAFDREMTAERARELGAGVANAAGSGPLCAVNLDAITLTGMDSPSAVCRRALVADPEGRTNVRREPRSGSPVLRVMTNGEGVDIMRRRGAWLLVAEGVPGWIHRSNVRCLR